MFSEKRLRLAVLTSSLLLSLAPWSTANAQLCFRGHLRPRCTGFAVLEFTAAARLNRKAGPTDQSPAFMSWSVGYLGNVGPRSSLGAAFKLTADGDGHRYGPVLRYRRWLGPTWSVDIAPGLLVGGQDNFTTLRFPSATTEMAINWGDRMAFAVGMDALRREGRATSWEGYFGLRFGTWLAPLATLGLGIVAGAAAASSGLH